MNTGICLAGKKVFEGGYSPDIFVVFVPDPAALVAAARAVAGNKPNYVDKVVLKGSAFGVVVCRLEAAAVERIPELEEGDYDVSFPCTAERFAQIKAGQRVGIAFVDAHSNYCTFSAWELQGDDTTEDQDLNIFYSEYP